MKQNKIKTSLTTSKERKIKLLIDAALTRYSPEELFTAFLDNIYNDDLETVAKVAMKNETFKDEAKNVIESELQNEFIVIPTKALNLNQEIQLSDFLQTKIFPYYSEQQTFLTF